MSMAIITGASSGVGREYVLAACRQHPEIEEFVLIARRADRLAEVQDEVGEELTGRQKVGIFPADLTKKEDRARLSDFLIENEADVKLLVNNAGFGLMGEVELLDAEKQADMAALNCGALTALCSMVLPYMNKGGVIINVCSIAAFVPTPRMTTYSATKAYVFSFSKALREETKKRGINVLAVCPAPMDTEFLAIAGIEGKSKLFDRLPHVSPKKVAEKSLRKAFMGRAVYTNGLLYKLYRVLGKLLPHNWLMGTSTV